MSNVPARHRRRRFTAGDLHYGLIWLSAISVVWVGGLVTGMVIR